jgi:hypothetical protein
VGTTENKRLIPLVLDQFKLESEQPLFKMAMISNLEWTLELPPLGCNPAIPFVNPLTKLWREFDANSALSASLPKYIKLAQIAVVHLLGSVEDERAFSSLTFLKGDCTKDLSVLLHFVQYS